MQLKIGYWPPLASHLAAIVIGLGSAGVFAGSRVPNLPVPRHGVLISLDGAVDRIEGEDPWAKGELYFQAEHDPIAECLVFPQTVSIVRTANQPLVAASSHKAAAMLGRMRFLRGVKGYFILRDANTKKAKPCPGGSRS